MVRAVFLDIDGTLRDERRGIPESAEKAVRLCRASGVLVVLCTGRNMASIQPDVRELEVDGVIAGGGALILDGGVVQRRMFFRYEEIRGMTENLSQGALPFALETQERIFMNQAAGVWFRRDFERKLEGLGKAEKERRRRENGICYRDNMGEYRPERDAVHKICIWCSSEEEARAAAEAGRIGSIVQQGERGEWRYLEALPPGCTKGRAVREWCGIKGINPADAISFGDGKNDIDMLRATGIGVAMADGDEELKSCASAVCEPAVEDGIYRELARQNVIGNGLEANLGPRAR